MTYNWTCRNHEAPHFQYSLQSMLEVIKVPACDKCGEPMARVYDVPGLHFSGGGWGKDSN
jgi:predicted nucleic acid-binding Zn ribbon protein